MHTDKYKPNLSGLAGREKQPDSVFVHEHYAKGTDHGTKMYKNAGAKMSMKKGYNSDY